jgi:hypothetical protein
MSLIIILLLTFLNSQMNEVFNLESYVWKNRIVLVFTNGDTNTNYQAQVDMLVRDIRGIEERDMKIFKISHDNTAEDLLSKKTLRAKNNIREKYNLSDEGFRVLLIGKDGSVKYSDSNPVSKEKLFAIIDAMPMRKAEMRNR